MQRESLDHVLRAEHEYPRIPQKTARIEHFLSARSIRFLNKSKEIHGLAFAGPRQFEIAASRFRAGGCNAECHNFALTDRVQPALKRLMKSLNVGNDMIRRRHK